MGPDPCLLIQPQEYDWGFFSINVLFCFGKGIFQHTQQYKKTPKLEFFYHPFPVHTGEQEVTVKFTVCVVKDSRPGPS